MNPDDEYALTWTRDSASATYRRIKEIRAIDAVPKGTAMERIFADEVRTEPALLRLMEAHLRKATDLAGAHPSDRTCQLLLKQVEEFCRDLGLRANSPDGTRTVAGF